MKRVLRLAEHRHRPSGKTASFIEHHDFRSVYQPILSPTHQKMVGYEALVRVRRGNQPVAPPSLFEQASIQGVTSELDRQLKADELREATRLLLEIPADQEVADPVFGSFD